MQPLPTPRKNQTNLMEIKTYYSLNSYLKETFGCKVYKLSLDGGFTCPNRDGTLDTRGCIFCSAGGSGDFAENRSLSITEQIESGKARVCKKIGENGKYIAYFQAFTNTYAPVRILKEKYEEALSHPDIVALSIATRPDCLNDEIISLLLSLNKVKPVWIELGLQTIHSKTAEYIRRGYSLEVYDNAVKKLTAAGITVITHMIIGLPGETIEDMIETARYIGNSGSSGIKLQLLHVLKGTDLASDYLAGKFEVLSLNEYIDIVCRCLEVLPDNMVIHRITGDGDKKTLIAPLWSGDKKKVLNEFAKRIRAK